MWSDQMQGAIARIGLLVGLLCVACTSTPVSDTASAVTPRPAATERAEPKAETLEMLTLRYEACVREAGITNAEAQVLRINGTLLVKTAPEIPAAIHSPCFVAIGGSPTLAASSWGSVTGPGAVFRGSTGIVDLHVSHEAPCPTITVAFGNTDGPVDAPKDIERVMTSQGTRFVLPQSVDLVAISPARRAFWDNGVALPVIDGPVHYLFVVDDSCSEPMISYPPEASELTLTFTGEAPSSVVTLDDAFLITELAAVGPGRVSVSGWGAAFEAHAGVGVVDTTGNFTTEKWSVEGGTSTVGSSVRMGNPGVAWAPFSFDLVGLPAGEYGLYLDSCGGQCDLEPPFKAVPFTVDK